MRSGKDVYPISPLSRKRTTLPYHSLQRVEASRGKILYDFIQGFTGYLAGWGITSRVKERTFHPFAKVPEKRAGLPLHLLETVYVYDNRLQPAHQPAPAQHVALQAYVDLITRLLAKLQPGLRFAPITDLAQAHGHPVLALQDHEEEDFKEQGLLFGVPDPSAMLYAAFPHLTKQSLTVNSRDADEKKGLTPHADLSYRLQDPGPEEES